MTSFEIDNSSILSYPIFVNSIQSFLSISPVITNITFFDNVGYSNSSFVTLNFTPYRFLKRIEIGNQCFEYVREFVIDGLESLESVKIGVLCFGIDWEERDDGICRITNCPNLRQSEIGHDSFYYFKSFELFYVNSLQSIKFGERCFRHADFSLKGE